MNNKISLNVLIKAEKQLKQVPSHEWIGEKYTDGKSKCCIIGHYTRLNSKNPSNYYIDNCRGEKCILWKQ